jgi:hypothetical protein
MSRYRTYTLAGFGAILLMALSLSAAFGAKPTGADGDTNRGQQVSEFVHSLFNSDEDSDEDASEDEDADADADAEEEEADEEDSEVDSEEETEDSAPSDHGQCVALVAQNAEAVGPPNDNHGGAVNVAAREDCWDADEESSDEESSDEEVDASTTSHGKSGEHRGKHGKHGG